MTITVRLFASYRELIGQERITLQVAAGETVGDAVQRLRQRFPALAGLTHAPLTAVNLAHAEGGHLLREGDELALFPPVSGG